MVDDSAMVFPSTYAPSLPFHFLLSVSLEFCCASKEILTYLKALLSFQLKGDFFIIEHAQIQDPRKHTFLAPVSCFGIEIFCFLLNFKKN